MSEGKFASLTAGLLVRKGEARPSSVMPPLTFSPARVPERIEVLPVQDWTPKPPALPRRDPPKPLTVVPACEPLRMEAPFVPEPAPVRAAASAKPAKARSVASSGNPPPPAGSGKQRRLMVSLSPGEYETLGIIGVKKNATRHQLLRSALDEYLALLVEEYSGDCQCIYTGGSCNNSCSQN